MTNSDIQDNQQLFAQTWKQCKLEYCFAPCGGDCTTCQPAPYVVARLFRLIASEPSKPIRELAPTIARMLAESRYTSAGGDSLAEGKSHPPIEKQTELVVQTLERMRQTSTT